MSCVSTFEFEIERDGAFRERMEDEDDKHEDA